MKKKCPHLILPKISLAQVKISEFLAHNVAVNPDNWDFEDFSGWIELHNEGANAVDIGGYYLTGDLKQTKKWQIPSGTSISANGYLLIWADDHDGKPGQQETREWYPWNEKYTLKGYHAVFCLDKDGEQVGLFKADGSVVDSVTYPKQFPDVSMGRKADGSWAFFDEPTPGAANTTTAKPLSTSSHNDNVTFSVEGGMYSSSQSIILYAEGGNIFTQPTVQFRMRVIKNIQDRSLSQKQRLSGPDALLQTNLLEKLSPIPSLLMKKHER